jgi:hypothetical protein
MHKEISFIVDAKDVLEANEKAFSIIRTALCIRSVVLQGYHITGVPLVETLDGPIITWRWDVTYEVKS